LAVWVLAIAAAVILVLMAIGVSQYFERARAARRRERVRREFDPLFARFLETEDQVRLAEELRPAFRRMDAAHRPVAAVLVADMMQECRGAVDRGDRVYPVQGRRPGAPDGLGDRRVAVVPSRPGVVALEGIIARPHARRPGWGTIPRGAGILEEPAQIVAPLTR
jgi:hypothetical protein